MPPKPFYGLAAAGSRVRFAPSTNNAPTIQVIVQPEAIPNYHHRAPLFIGPVRPTGPIKLHRHPYKSHNFYARRGKRHYSAFVAGNYKVPRGSKAARKHATGKYGGFARLAGRWKHRQSVKAYNRIFPDKKPRSNNSMHFDRKFQKHRSRSYREQHSSGASGGGGAPDSPEMQLEISSAGRTQPVSHVELLGQRSLIDVPLTSSKKRTVQRHLGMEDADDDDEFAEKIQRVPEGHNVPFQPHLPDYSNEEDV